MFTITVPPVVRERIIQIIDAIVSGPTESVVLLNDLKDCYDGVDDGGGSADVKLDLTGTATLPVGASLDFELKKVDEATGSFTDVPFTVNVGSDGTTTMEIDGDDHRVTEGCANFLVYFVAKYPNSTRKKILLIKSFQICEECTDTEPEGDTKPRA